MKNLSSHSVIFSLRTFAAAMLALYVSYSLDLSRPTWAFITTYIVSAPLRGAGRSKGLYRICGTVCGAAFAVAAVPNLVDAPELMVLTIACWIAGCLYLSILDGTPRSYAFMLSGYTAALIGFPSVNAPQTIFDTALSRTEEIGLAILCVELMGYLPFHRRAGDALLARIDKCFLDTRALSLSLLGFHPHPLPIAARAKLMIEVASIDDLRIQAHYDTPGFKDIEAWTVRLQRFLRDFFTDLITLDAQLQELQSQGLAHLLSPYLEALHAWIDQKTISIPEQLNELLTKAKHDPSQEPLAKSGALDTLTDLVTRRSECLSMRQKIADGVKSDQKYVTIARYIDRRQAGFYGLTVALLVIAASAFWIASEWPDGSTATMMMAVVCCFFASLEAPPELPFIFMGGTIIGAAIGWFYNFIVFPHIEGMPLLVTVLALSCIPIGIGMANPLLTGAMVPLMLGINLADMRNRYGVDIEAFQNGFVAQTLGICLAGVGLSFVRTITLESATRQLVDENARTLAFLASGNSEIRDDAIDRLTHRSALALVRASKMQRSGKAVTARVLHDLQTADVLIKLRRLEPSLPEDVRQIMQKITQRLEDYFAANRHDRDHGIAFSDMPELDQLASRHAHNANCMRLAGLMRTLSRNMKEEAAA